MTLEIKRACLLLAAAVATVGCGASLPGNGGTGGTQSAAECCPRGGVSFATVVRARGFTSYEGRPVKAAFISTVHSTSETIVSAGAFDLAFPPYTPTCSDESSLNAVGAIYIDADGDGVCNPAVDYLYAWTAFGAAGSTCATIDLTPQSPKCGGLIGSLNLIPVEAARVVCPATDGCLSCPSDADGRLAATCSI